MKLLIHLMGEEKHDLAAFEIFTHFLVTLYGKRRLGKPHHHHTFTINGTFYYREGVFFYSVYILLIITARWRQRRRVGHSRAARVMGRDIAITTTTTTTTTRQCTKRYVCLLAARWKSRGQVEGEEKWELTIEDEEEHMVWYGIPGRGREGPRGESKQAQTRRWWRGATLIAFKETPRRLNELPPPIPHLLPNHPYHTSLPLGGSLSNLSAARAESAKERPTMR